MGNNGTISSWRAAVYFEVAVALASVKFRNRETEGCVDRKPPCERWCFVRLEADIWLGCGLITDRCLPLSQLVGSYRRESQAEASLLLQSRRAEQWFKQAVLLPHSFNFSGSILTSTQAWGMCDSPSGVRVSCHNPKTAG